MQIESLEQFHELYDDFKARDRAWLHGDRDENTLTNLRVEFAILRNYAKENDMSILKPFHEIPFMTITVHAVNAK